MGTPMPSVCRAGFCGAVALLGGTVLVLAQPPAPAVARAPNPEAVARAEGVLAESRKALGGDKLAALKTLVASGRTRRIRGNNLVPIEFEIFVELPDKYLRTDEFPAEDTDPTSSGFNGDALIQIPPLPASPAPGRGMNPPGAPGDGPASPAPAVPSPATPAGPPAGASGAPAPSGIPPASGAPSLPPGAPGTMPSGRGGAPPDPRRARVTALKQEYARLSLGLFASPGPYPLTFSYAALAEAPQGQADVLEAKGEGNFALRFFISRETRLPIMVTWTTPPTNVIVTVPGQPPPQTIAPGAVVVTGPPAPPPGAAKEEADIYTKEVLALRTKAQATPVEHRLYFGDYREVDGLRLPFRLRRAIGTETTEETTFDRFRLDSRIDQRKFQP